MLKKVIWLSSLIGVLSFTSCGSGDGSKGAKEVQYGKWVKPSQSACESGGGTYNNNVCSANLENANNICSMIGGVLPTIEELRLVITDCGGVVNFDTNINNDININNDNYQSCYQEQGFSSGYYYYWSSSVFDTLNSWVIYFYLGNSYGVSNDYNRDVDIRCIKR